MRRGLLLVLITITITLPITPQSLRVPGLEQPVSVVRDKWGVPHIYAQNQHDLFFAQGFVQATDRLYQMEMWKRAGQGRLAEILGSSFVGRDIVARKLRYRGSMKEEYASYAPDAESILRAFTDGINAYIDSRSGNPSLEFRLAGFAPEHWRPEDCVQRMAAYAMMSNAAAELRNAKLLTALGVKNATELLAPEPKVTLDPAAGFDYAMLDDAMLRDFIGSDFRIEVPPDGSNNWVLSAAKTATGKPFLANDPHRTLSLPSLRYLVHLVAPGWNVIGAVEPALPGVAIGHNESIAWGLTIFAADQQDLYIETLSGGGGKYQTASGWKRLRVEHDSIRVKGGPPVAVTYEFTRHGPVIWKKGSKAVALRWVGKEPGTAGYLGSLSLDRAHDWKEFRDAMRRWKVPGENMVYADRDGHIGEQSAALTPRRSWTGLLPVDGTGRNEWRGFYSIDDLPHSFDPDAHFIATANHRMVALDEQRHIAHEWGSPVRVERIREVLGGSKRFSIDDMIALQNDVLSLTAREAIRLLRNTGADDEASKMMTSWDGVVNAGSAPAALYELWMRRLRTESARRTLLREIDLERGAHGTALRVAAWPPHSISGIAEQVVSPGEALAAIAAMPERNEILTTTLRDAFADARTRLGDDPARWRWGTLHAARFRHGLDQRGDPSTLDPAPLPRPGDGDTVNATAMRPPSFDQVHGATFREILDLSDWDRSLAINAPGQSGDPSSRHYKDLLPLWDRGEYFPLVYSRPRINAEAESTVTLSPR